MLTLRELARSDRAVGAVSADECHLIGAVLQAVATSKLARLVLPRDLRRRSQAIAMLGATFARTEGERDTGDFQVQLFREMQRNK